MNLDSKKILAEQGLCLKLSRAGMSYPEIAVEMNISQDAVYRRMRGARKVESLDPELARRLADNGLTDLSGLHSGWLLDKDDQGSGASLYFYMGPDQEKISFTDAILECLSDIPKLEPIKLLTQYENVSDLANWLAIADLHVGGDWGDEVLEHDFYATLDDVIGRLPEATHAVLFELGDLLEANDHKGVTPASANPLDVKRGPDEMLKSKMTAIKLLRHAVYRLLQTHETVEVHFIKGNHDPSSHQAVMLSLNEHFSLNPRVEIVVTSKEYRVISWGECAAFPHHGDTIKWPALKDVWADQFPDEWAAAKMYRIIMTAHFHHDKRVDLIGAVAEQFRTLHKPNNWAKGKGLLSRGTLTAMTVHKTLGERHRTISQVRPLLRGA